MSRLFVHVEGETEESFVNNVLRPHLCVHGYSSVDARMIGNPRQRARRGGIQPWPTVRTEIIRHLRHDQGCLSTTMVDYYGLPSHGNGAWPGRASAGQLPFDRKAEAVHLRISEDVGSVGGDSEQRRFVPHVVMHEYEGLLFSDCERFAECVGAPELVPAFQAIRDRVATPEHINDDPETAPSKRVMELVPGYQKVTFGTQAASEIGLQTLRRECPNLNGWLTRLESLADSA